MGLAMVYGIVRQAEGHIHCTSSPGRGTSFEILLPAASVAEDHFIPEKEIAPVVTKPGQVLLVDDDPALLSSVTRILERGGHTVTAVSTPKEAIQLAEGGGTFDVLVSDVVMPEMNGVELAPELRRWGTVGPVLLISGHPEDALPLGSGVTDEEMTLLQKPFSSERLLTAVAQMIGNPAPPTQT